MANGDRSHQQAKRDRGAGRPHQGGGGQDGHGPRPDGGGKTEFGGVDGTACSAAWIESGLTPEAIQYAEAFGRSLKEQKLTTSQIRNVFGEVKRIEMELRRPPAAGSAGFDEQRLLMLRPRLAYATERKGTGGSRAFQKVLQPALDAVLRGSTPEERRGRLQRFAHFFEAILAYHRAEGGQ